MPAFIALGIGIVWFVVRYWYFVLPLLVIVWIGTSIYDAPGRMAKRDVVIDQIVIEGGEPIWSVGYRIENHTKDFVVSNLHFICDGSKETAIEVKDIEPGTHTGFLPFDVVDAALSESVSYCKPVYDMRRM